MVTLSATPEARPTSAKADETFLVRIFERMALTPREILRAVTHHLENLPEKPELLAWQNLTQRIGQRHALQQEGRIGDTLTAEQVGELLGKTRQAVHADKLAQRVLVFARPHRRGDCYPWLQFDPATHAVRPWVVELIARVGNGAAAVSFLTARRRSLSGESYADRLRAGDHSVVPAMLAQARKPGEMDAPRTDPAKEDYDAAPAFAEAQALGEDPGIFSPATAGLQPTPAAKSPRRSRKK